MGKLSVAVVLVLTASSSAETLNVNFAAPGSTPAATYAAAGQAGTWNTVTGIAGDYFSLVTTDGMASNVMLDQSPTTTLITTTDAALSGDDAKLMNTGLLTTGAETCLFFRSMTPGDYDVLVYAWVPGAPAVKSRTRQDEAPTTIDVGGAWTGSQVEGVTYARYRVTVDASGLLPVHSGLVPGQSKAALNAVQIRPYVPGGGGPDAGPGATPEPDAGDGDGAGDPVVDDPHHGGGCSAGGGSGGGAMLVALGLVLARRRRDAR